jgi:predicted acetyltransferase
LIADGVAMLTRSVAELTLPTVDVRESFVVAMAELQAEGRGSPSDDSMVGREIRQFGGQWHTAAGFAAYVEQLRAESLEETPRPDGWVPSTTWWYVDGQSYLGRIALRHRLNDGLLEVGGHIGYDVRPSARRQGHATAMLLGVLGEARDMGIDEALLTCDEDNIASRIVIERAGARYEDSRNGKRRYWVPAAA